MKRITFQILFFLHLASCAFSQGFYFGFDNCSLAEMGGEIPNIVANNDTTCVCGVLDQSLLFDGVNDYYILPDTVKSMFLDDFTFGFNFWLDSNIGNQPLFAIKDSCDKDSTITLRYIPSINQMELNVSERTGTQWNSRTELNDNLCWHRFVLTKEGNIYNYYIDNIFVEAFDNLKVSPLSALAKVYLGTSPCVGILDSLFEGKIDEIFLDRRAWSFAEIRNSDYFADQIITMDTTIFEGNSVEIMTGNTCSNTFSWSPTTDMLGENTTMPTVSPSETTVYTYTVDHGGCQVTDQIQINVVDEDDLQCSDLILPNVFTPNNDSVNDVFGISNGFLVEELISFEIFDRWGGKLFETSEKSENWDGFYNGDEISTGMFIYKIEYTCQNETYSKQGSFSLMR